MLYAIIEEGNDAVVKLGYSETRGELPDLRAAKQRRSTLSVGNWRPLVVIAIAPGSREDERELHYLCGHLRVHGEWFYNKSVVTRWLAKYRIT